MVALFAKINGNSQSKLSVYITNKWCFFFCLTWKHNILSYILAVPEDKFWITCNKSNNWFLFMHKNNKMNVLVAALTFTAHCLQSSSLKQCPITSGHRVCKGLFFKSNHLSCFRLTQLSGKELSWLLYKSSRLSWLRLPKSFGSSTRAFLLKSSRTKWRRVQNASYKRNTLHIYKQINIHSFF